MPAGSLGYADAVVVRSGDTAEYSYDFELPASENSTASVAAGAATATGGWATVTLNASAISATPTVPFTIVVTLPDGTEQTEVVEVDADSTDELSIPVPFGTTHVEVWAQDTLIAEGDVTFTAPVHRTPPVTPPVVAVNWPRPDSTRSPRTGERLSSRPGSPWSPPDACALGHRTRAVDRIDAIHSAERPH